MLVFPVKAQAEDVDLEKIVISASRVQENYNNISRKVDVITAKDIENAAASSPADVLRKINSVDIKDYGGPGAAKTVQIRGSTSSQVLIMMDGRPINNAHGGDVDLNTIPVENIARIEAVRGGASSLYGSSAMGGAINIITKKAPKKGARTTFTTSFGTYRTYLEQLTHGAGIGPFSYLITGDYKSSQGIRDHNEYTAKNASLKLGYEFSEDNAITLNSGFHKSNYEPPGSLTFPDYSDYQQQLKRFFDFYWNAKLFDVIGIFLRGYENYDRMEFTENPMPLDKSTHVTKTRGWELQLDYKPFEFYRVIGGFNYVGNYDDSNVTRKHEYLLRAGYLQNQLEFLQGRLKSDFGARMDNYSNFKLQINPNINLLYKPSPKTRIRLSHSRSFRVPTFSDLYWPNDGWTEGNANLIPEKGKSYDFEIEKDIQDKVTLRLGYFRNDFSNMIKWDTDSTGLLWKPQNISKASIQGVEFESNIRFLENFQFKTGYTFQRPMSGNTGKFLTYQPQYKINNSLEYDNLSGTRVSLQADFVNREFFNEENTGYLKRYFILGMDASQKIGRYTTFFMSVDNMANAQYRTQNDYPMPGFSITGGLKLEI